MAWQNDYVDVAERLSTFFEKYPEGSIQCEPAEIKIIGDKTFISVVATVFRHEKDLLPSVAQAWEPFPGTTNFTRNSECMNAETSAIGRALALVGLHTKRSIATKQEVANRKAEQEAPAEKRTFAQLLVAINEADKKALPKLAAEIKATVIDEQEIAELRIAFNNRKEKLA